MKKLAALFLTIVFLCTIPVASLSAAGESMLDGFTFHAYDSSMTVLDAYYKQSEELGNVEFSVPYNTSYLAVSALRPAGQHQNIALTLDGTLLTVGDVLVFEGSSMVLSATVTDTLTAAAEAITFTFTRAAVSRDTGIQLYSYAPWDGRGLDDLDELTQYIQSPATSTSIDVDKGTDAVLFAVMLNDLNSTCTVYDANGDAITDYIVPLPQAKTGITVEVVAQDGTAKAYTVSFAKATGGNGGDNGGGDNGNNGGDNGGNGGDNNGGGNNGSGENGENSPEGTPGSGNASVITGDKAVVYMLVLLAVASFATASITLFIKYKKPILAFFKGKKAFR